MTRPSTTRAVLFDLYNTLVPGGSRVQRDEVSRRMARVLGVDPDRLAASVRASFDDRTRARLGGLPETVAHLAHELGADPDDDAIHTAVQLRLTMTRGLLSDTSAIDVLAMLLLPGLRVTHRDGARARVVPGADGDDQELLTLAARAGRVVAFGWYRPPLAELYRDAVRDEDGPRDPFTTGPEVAA